MSKDDIKIFWNKRAEKFGSSLQSTTNDVYMRKLECSVISDCIKEILSEKSINNIADIGCGNGFSTLEIAKMFPQLEIHGFDYAEKMIASANKLKMENNINNLNFFIFDIVEDKLSQAYDLVITDRCLINLPTWEMQKKAINLIHNTLSPNGVYLMMENFTDGEQNFNMLRRSFGLNEIRTMTMVRY